MPDPKIIEQYIEKVFGHFGVNKKREIARLVYEVAKREKIPFKRILAHKEGYRYSLLKGLLIKRRYPNAYIKENNLPLYLPQLKIYPEYRVENSSNSNFSPKNIFIEMKISKSYLVSRFKEFFPRANFKRIDTLKNYIKDKTFGIEDYNKRGDNIFIVGEKYDFFKKCPCTKGAIFCGYNIFNLGLGCIYECTYCYLQQYLSSLPGIIIPANLNDFFDKFSDTIRNRSAIFKKYRIGSGEFSDSLALDEITEFSLPIIEFFRKKPNFYFEFKTKSKFIKNILKAKPTKNIIISWSLNPDGIINENEWRTASLKERLFTASECVKAGYKVGFHFDPIIYRRGQESEYRKLVNLLFDQIPSESVAWISLGTLRFNPLLKKMIENRFPENKILDEELILGFDKKLRYHQKLRVIIYKKMKGWIRKRTKKVMLYLCMEDRKVWQEFR